MSAILDLPPPATHTCVAINIPTPHSLNPSQCRGKERKGKEGEEDEKGRTEKEEVVVWCEGGGWGKCLWGYEDLMYRLGLVGNYQLLYI